MTSKTIPADKLFAEWAKDPEFRQEYEALNAEFALAATVISARKNAGLSQKELAERMGTSQAAIARLEGGHIPSMRTLEKLAAATGTRLKITFEQDITA